MERSIDVDAERRERLRRPAGIERRERIAPGISEIRIGEASGWVRDRDLCAPRRVVGEARVEEEVRRVIEDTPRGAHARLLVSLRRPHRPNSRRKLRDLAERRGIAWVAVVTGED